MDGKSQTPTDGKHACPNCVRVFSSLKAVHGHQRMHKITVNNNSPLPRPPPPKNPYDGHEAFVYPGEESESESEEEEEGGEITSDDGSQCARKNASSPEAIEIKMEDLPPDFIEAAATLLMLQYGSGPRGGVCLSSTASDSNNPQENPKTKVKVKVNPQTSVAAPKQENSTGSSSDDGGSRVFECNRCHKRFGTQQALGGHMAGHKNTDRKAAAMAEGGTPSASQIVKEHKCESCGLTFDSGQALGGHMRKHRVLVNWKDDEAVVVVKKEVTENVITEDIHGRNDDRKRIRLTLDLNHEPIDIEDD